MELTPFIKNKRIRVRVIPNAHKTELRSTENNILKIAIAAHPEDKKANKELIRFFKKGLRLNVRIKSGATSKNKILEIIQP